MKNFDEKVFQDVFDAIVRYCEWLEYECHHSMSYDDVNRYVTGARYALNIVLDHDYDSCVRLRDLFNQKLDDYFGGKESE